MELAAAVLALAAASPAPPAVAVVSREVALTRPDEAPIELRCNRTKRTCRGVLVVAIERCSGYPVAIEDCHIPLGRRRFAIGPRRTATVVVPRMRAQEFRANGAEDVVVTATPYRKGERVDRTTRWTRHVTLVASPELPRPELSPHLRAAQRLVRNADSVRFVAAGARDTRSLSVAFDGHDVALHAEMFSPYLLGRRSFAVAGVAWHGELPVEEGRYKAGERHPFALTSCGTSACVTTRGGVTLASDPSLIPRPICALGPR